jgi:hypothetical protein
VIGASVASQEEVPAGLAVEQVEYSRSALAAVLRLDVEPADAALLAGELGRDGWTFRV